MDDLIIRLRKVARGIEKHALKKKRTLDDRAEPPWPRFNSYEDLRDDLNFIDGEKDTEICIDAHDLALERPQKVTLVTNNPTDFVFYGYDDKVTERTAIDDVHSVAHLESEASS